MFNDLKPSSDRINNILENRITSITSEIFPYNADGLVLQGLKYLLRLVHFLQSKKIRPKLRLIGRNLLEDTNTITIDRRVQIAKDMERYIYQLIDIIRVLPSENKTLESRDAGHIQYYEYHLTRDVLNKFREYTNKFKNYSFEQSNEYNLFDDLEFLLFISAVKTLRIDSISKVDEAIGIIFEEWNRRLDEFGRKEA